jgi:lipid-A-disaccharide synthase
MRSVAYAIVRFLLCQRWLYTAWTDQVSGISLVLHEIQVTRRILISCGEASGDLFAAELVRELARLDDSVECFGLGGERLAQAGAELLVTLDKVSVIGLVEVLGKIPALRRARDTLLEAAAARRPEAAVLIDFSGFNLRLAKKLKKMGIPIVYYVSPQVWAWRRRRVRTIRDTASKMLVIYPFEEDFYRSEGVPVCFVGHPIVDLVRLREDRSRFCERVGVDPNRTLVAIMPGSRPREIEIHLPILARALELIAAKRSDLDILVLKASTIDKDELLAGLGRVGPWVHVVEDATYEGLAYASVAVVASGTATVEAALSGTPMVVVYRVGRLSYRLGKPFVHLPHYAMVNLIARKTVVPELIQDDMTPEAIAHEALDLIESPAAADAMRNELAEVKARLGGGGASARAAEEVINVINATK